MATGRSSFAKRQRDMAKKAKAAAKREKRLSGDEEPKDADVIVEDQLSSEEFMARMEQLQRRYDDGEIDLDTFDEERANLTARMVVD